MIEVCALRDLDLAREIGHAHLQETDIIRRHETGSVFSLWLFLGFSFSV